MSIAPATVVRCSRCYRDLPVDVYNTGGYEPCPACAASTQVLFFPAGLRPLPESGAGAALQDETAASCYYHPGREAATTCEHCGRFVCALCDLELAGRHLCAGCAEAGRRKERFPRLIRGRMLFDGATLAIAALPIVLPFLFIFSIVTAPMALVLAVWHWNSPSSLLPRTKIRLWLAIILSVLQILAWIIGIYVIFQSIYGF